VKCRRYNNNPRPLTGLKKLMFYMCHFIMGFTPYYEKAIQVVMYKRMRLDLETAHRHQRQ